MRLTIFTAGWAAFALSCAAADPITFKPGAPGEFTFDTGVLKGVLRAGGASRGLSQLYHIATGARLDSSMGLLSHYRVFSVGKRYGAGAWDWPSEATLQPDGSVQVRWPEQLDRPFELTARYRWESPAVVEVETGVRTSRELRGFEVFLASYFTPAFTNAWVYAGTIPAFEPARQAEGDWQAFPRDSHSAAIFRDGRWAMEPHPVKWVLRQPFANPLALRYAREMDLSAVLMSDSRHCFAVCTPYETEAHFSTYFSLFGRDLKPGEHTSARVRCVFIKGADTEKALEANQHFAD